MPDSFVARFAPQLWFAPPLALAALLVVEKHRLLRVIAAIGIGILAVNAFGVAGTSVGYAVRDSEDQKSELARLAHAGVYTAQFGGWQRAEARQLREAGLQFVAVRKAACRRQIHVNRDGRVEQYTRPRDRPRGVLLCSVKVPTAPAP